MPTSSQQKEPYTHHIKPSELKKFIDSEQLASFNAHDKPLRFRISISRLCAKSLARVF